MKIFVVGGTETLGLPVVEALIKAGNEVASTARTPEKARRLHEHGVEAHNVDVFSASALREAIRGSDAVIRLTTAIPSLLEIRKRGAWSATNRLRTEGTHALIEACRKEGIPRYVSESVVYLYADGGDRWLRESADTDTGHSDILNAVQESEQATLEQVKDFGTPVVLRFGGFYGPDAPSSKETVAMMKKRMVPRIGPGRNYFSSIYVEDAATAVVAALSTPSGVYNIVDDQPLQFSDYLNAIAAAFDTPRPLRLPGFLRRVAFGSVGEYIGRSLRVSNSSFRKATGWSPVVTNASEGWHKVAQVLSRPAPGPDK